MVLISKKDMIDDKFKVEEPDDKVNLAKIVKDEPLKKAEPLSLEELLAL